MAQELHRDSDENNKHTPKGFTAGALSSYPVKSEKGLSVYDKRNILPQAINFVDGNAAPPTTASGDIYVLIDLGNGAVNAGWGASVYNDWTRSDGSAYFPITPLVGDLCNSAAGDWYKFDGAQWVLFGVGATDTNIANSNLSLDAARTTDMSGFNLTIDNTGAAATLGIHNETTDFGTAGSGLRLLAAGGAFQMLSTSRTGPQEFFVLHTPAGQTTFSHATAQGFRVIEDVGGQVQMLLQDNKFAIAPNIDVLSKFYVKGQGSDNTTSALLLENFTLNELLRVKNGGEIVIGQTPTTDNTNNNILVRDGVTGAIELRDASTIGSNIYNTNGTLTGARTVTQAGNGLTFTGGAIGIGQPADSAYKLRIRGDSTNSQATWALWVTENDNKSSFIVKNNSNVHAPGKLGVGIPISPAMGNVALHVNGKDLLGTSSALLVENSGGALTMLDIRNNSSIGLYGATPVVQATTAGAAATFTANTSGIADDTATFDGYTLGQVVKALRNLGILA